MLLEHEAPAAVAFSVLIAISSWRLPTALGILLTYGAMIASQTSGVEIIEHLHNKTAAVAAAAPPEDVSPDSSFDALCAGYEGHHYHSTSNCSHACGMILSFGFVAVLFRALLQRRFVTALRVLSVLPPTWYLYAWFGHFVYQADIPAVFTYGMTLRGWAAGELCSVLALAGGRTVGPLGPNPDVGQNERALTAVLILGYVLVALPAWRASWAFEKVAKDKRE